MTSEQLAQSIKSAATRIGFDWCGICPAVQSAGYDRFRDWIQSGYHGQMDYLETRSEAYAHPSGVMENAQSVLMLALRYSNQPETENKNGYGKVARYAWGTVDYHDVIHGMLKQLKREVLELRPESSVRGVVDSAPLLEREFAQLAGLGWQGKNTLVLNQQAGSWFFLSAMLFDFLLPADSPQQTEHCGTCTACLDACPTDAFVGPGVLDATKCISYLTIELRDPIPEPLREPIGDWLFGCDVCQDVCPWNSKSQSSRVAEFAKVDSLASLDLHELFLLTDDDFRKRFRKTPLWRSKRRGILRNAAIVLGNQQNVDSFDSLKLGLNDNPEPLIRGASAWALAKIGAANVDDSRFRVELEKRLAIETDSMVSREIEHALQRIQTS